MRLVRAVIGLLSLVGGIVIIVIPKTSTVTVTTSNEVIFVAALMVVWMIFSAINKVDMIVDSSATWPTWTALATWCVFGITLLAIVFGTTSIQPIRSTRFEDILALSLFIGWPIVDLLDLLLLRPVQG